MIPKSIIPMFSNVIEHVLECHADFITLDEAFEHHLKLKVELGATSIKNATSYPDDFFKDLKKLIVTGDVRIIEDNVHGFIIAEHDLEGLAHGVEIQNAHIKARSYATKALDIVHMAASQYDVDIKVKKSDVNTLTTVITSIIMNVLSEQALSEHFKSVVEDWKNYTVETESDTKRVQHSPDEEEKEKFQKALDALFENVDLKSIFGFDEASEEDEESES